MQQGLVDTVAAPFTPLSVRMRAFAFSQPYSIQLMVGVAPEREMVHFSKMATLLLAMFDLPLWGLILIVACTCFVLLLSAHVD